MPSIKEMKATIKQAGLGVADLLERADVEARYAEALARLDEAARRQTAQGSGAGPTGAPRTTPRGPADNVPSAVLAHALSFLDDWRAIGRSAVSRAWAAPSREDRVWLRALENRWPRLEAIDPRALGKYPRTRKARDACIALGGCWAAPRLTDRRVLGHPNIYGRSFSCCFALASTAPARPADLAQGGTRPVELVRRLSSNSNLFSYGLWSTRSSSAPKLQELKVPSTKKVLGDIYHDLTFMGSEFRLVRGQDDVRDALRSTTEVACFLGGAAQRAIAGLSDQAAIKAALAGILEDWEIFYEDGAGGSLYAPMREEHEGADDLAKFFPGVDEHHEPLGEGYAVYAFEHDKKRPDKLVSVAVFALAD